MNRVNRLLTLLLILLAVALLATPANASGCRAVIRREVIVEKVVTPAVVVAAIPVTPIVATFALYGATYLPPPAYAAPAPAYGAAPVAAPCTQQGGHPVGGNAEVLQYLKGLGDRLERLERASGIQPPARQGGMPPAGDPGPNPQAGSVERALQLVTRNCASCHDAGVAATKGGKFTLTNGGKFAEISPQALGEVINRVTTQDASKRMPKGGQMADAERLELVQALVAQPEPVKK